MSSISTILILLVLTAGSLFVVSLINQRQMRSRLLNQKLGKMKRRVTELEELSVSLEPLVENPKVPKIVNDEAIDLLETMLNIAPTNAYYQMAYETAQQRVEQLESPGWQVSTFRLMESDAAIARSQYALAEAARILRKRQASEHLQVAEMDTLLHDLSWSNFMIKVSSNIAQGHKAINRGDILRAFAYYRKALEVASEGGYKDERQNQIVSELGEILNNKRRALSPRLMPETLYNPEGPQPSDEAMEAAMLSGLTGKTESSDEEKGEP